jgi:hypothetical protein
LSRGESQKQTLDAIVWHGNAASERIKAFANRATSALSIGRIPHVIPCHRKLCCLRCVRSLGVCQATRCPRIDVMPGNSMPSQWLATVTA